MSKILSYEEKDTWIHRLSGVSKLIFFSALVSDQYAYL